MIRSILPCNPSCCSRMNWLLNIVLPASVITHVRLHHSHNCYPLLTSSSWSNGLVLPFCFQLKWE